MTPEATITAPDGGARVTITDIEMPFGSLIVLMVKWAFAAIPAIILVFTIIFVVFLAVVAVGGGVGAIIGAFAK